MLNHHSLVYDSTRPFVRYAISDNVLAPCGNLHLLQALGWVGQGLTSHSTHFRSFRRRWGGCGISQDCSHSQSPQCLRYWVVCARPLLITVVCMCIIWKTLCPYVLDARLGLWVSLEHAFTCASTTIQAEWRSSAAHLLARWEHKRTTARLSRAQEGGPYVIPTAGIHYKLRRL